MKKSLTGMLAVLVVAGSFGFSGVAQAANGNAYGHYKNPGNSEFGRSHNVKFNWDARFESRLEALIERLKARLAELEGRMGQTGTARVEITTGAAASVDEDSATVNGTADIEGNDTAKVWFQYGLSARSLSMKTSMETLTEDGSFDAEMTGLKDETTYYYRAVGQDKNGRRDFGTVKSFTTNEEGTGDDDDDTENAPEVATEQADSVTNNSAELAGSVDMNDFDNGRVFFVWGQDEDMVKDAGDEDTFDEIDEDGDDLQKEAIENGFDGSEDFTLEVDGLDTETEYYFAIGVEYENEDGDEVIEFADVRSFTTD